MPALRSQTRFAVLAVAVLAAAIGLAGAACSGSHAEESTATATPHRPASILRGPSATPTAATPTPVPSLTLNAVGDIMLARTIGQRVLTDGPGVVFGGVQPFLGSADITVGNLETSISNEGTPQAKSYTFRAPPAAAAALASGGFDVVSQANNHALDYGAAAMEDTLGLVRAQGVAVVGAGANLAEATAPAIIERNGLKVAFLGFVDTPPEGSYSEAAWAATATTPGVAWATPDAIRTAVEAARQKADIVVVMLHAGVEYSATPSAGQEALAEDAIDAGATLVLGAHPHVLQTVVRYGRGVIAYSLGNFVFDGFDGAANTSAIYQFVLTPAGVSSWREVPVTIVDGLPILGG